MFTKKDVGPHIHKALGIRHAMLKLRELLHDCKADIPKRKLKPGESLVGELMFTILESGDPSRLSGKPGECWEFDEAVQGLQTFTEEGLIWVWESNWNTLLLIDEDRWFYFRHGHKRPS
jgi:hypothetical protein